MSEEDVPTPVTWTVTVSADLTEEEAAEQREALEVAAGALEALEAIEFARMRLEDAEQAIAADETPAPLAGLVAEMRRTARAAEEARSVWERVSAARVAAALAEVVESMLARGLAEEE